jgi:hypothetical protein
MPDLAQGNSHTNAPDAPALPKRAKSGGKAVNGGIAIGRIRTVMCDCATVAGSQ